MVGVLLGVIRRMENVEERCVYGNIECFSMVVPVLGEGGGGG